MEQKLKETAWYLFQGDTRSKEQKDTIALINLAASVATGILRESAAQAVI